MLISPKYNPNVLKDSFEASCEQKHSAPNPKMASKFLGGSPVKLVLEAPELEDLRSERFGYRSR